MKCATRLTSLLILGCALAIPAIARNDQLKARKKNLDPDEIVCENQEILGTRLGTRKVCMTRAQWVEQRRDNRDLVDKSQVNQCLRKAGC